MFVSFDPQVRVSLTVVTLGEPARLRDCLAALVSHESRHDFTVVCVVNALTLDHAPRPSGLPGGVEVVQAEGNLGWCGGLHLGRSLVDAELHVWVQDDMTPEPGWLDALVDAADAHPTVGAFGAVRVDAAGAVLLHNAGSADPPGDIHVWSHTDRTLEDLPTEVATYDWVTSKGMLTRTALFDEVGGPDPRLFPLNHVDKEYCTHVRCHGWDVALVPGARLQHGQSLSSPTPLREFLAQWRDPWLSARWGGPVAELEGRTSGRVDHPCGDWRAPGERGYDGVEQAVGLEASRMLVPLIRARVGLEAAREAEIAGHVTHAQAVVADATAAYQAERDARERLEAELETLASRPRRTRGWLRGWGHER